MRAYRLPSALLALVPLAAVACEEYQPPPRAALEGLSSDGVVDAHAPLVVAFGTPVDPATLSVKLALDETDAEGNLGDEDDDPATELRVLARRDPHDAPGAGTGARADLDPDRTRLRLTPEAELPIGTPLVLLVEPGLRSTDSGRVARTRQRLRFVAAAGADAGAND